MLYVPSPVCLELIALLLCSIAILTLCSERMLFRMMLLLFGVKILTYDSKVLENCHCDYPPCSIVE